MFLLLQHYPVVDLESSKGSSSGQYIYNTWITGMSHISCHMHLQVVNGSCPNQCNQVASLSMLVLVLTDSDICMESEPLCSTCVMLTALVTCLSLYLLLLVRHMHGVLPTSPVLLTIGTYLSQSPSFLHGQLPSKRGLHEHRKTPSIDRPLLTVHPGTFFKS